MIQILQQQLVGESEQGWALTALPRPWQTFKADLDAATKYQFPELNIPVEYKNVDETTLIPDVYFSVFAHQEIEV